MWYVITANPVARTKKEMRKEYQVFSGEIIISAETKKQLEQKMKVTGEKYPEQMQKYLNAGIKIIEADNPNQAKKKAKDLPVYIEKTGQLKLF
jgi:Spy/CpxP family protein refolding chaperone